MLKTIAAIIGLILLLSVDASTGIAATNTPQSGPMGELGYACYPDLGACSCRIGEGGDCEDLLDAGMCQAPEDLGYPWDPELKGQGLPWFNFVDCDIEAGYCTCTMADGAMRQETSRRSEAFDPANENASEGAGEGHEMLVPPRRDAQPVYHRSPATENAPRSDDIVAPNNRTGDRQNETVSARRGTASTSDTVTDEAAESDEDAAPTERRVRDHR